jgi:hypothetical protein
MSSRREPELAYRGSIFRTVPNVSATIAVTGASATEPAATALEPYQGTYIWIAAVGADITLKRGTHTVVVGIGLTIKDGEREEFYVSPGDDHALSHIGSAAGTIVVLSDSEAG